MFANPPPEQVAELLRRAAIIAVVGLSADPTRPSHILTELGVGYRLQLPPEQRALPNHNP